LLLSLGEEHDCLLVVDVALLARALGFLAAGLQDVLDGILEGFFGA
jgi:hypothetical protein